MKKNQSVRISDEKGSQLSPQYIIDWDEEEEELTIFVKATEEGELKKRITVRHCLSAYNSLAFLRSLGLVPWETKDLIP